MVPRGLRAPLPAGGKAGVDGDAGPEDGRIEMELSNLAGDDYATDILRFVDSAHSPVNRIPGPFRLHAIFRPNLADMANTPILDSLTLDDVTLLYDPPGGPRILGWGEGAQ